MQRRIVFAMLMVLVLSYLPTNNLNDNIELTEKIASFTQTQGKDEYNPIFATGSGIEIDVNFTATQSQVWFKVYSLGPDTWINHSIQSSGSENLNLQYRAHTSLNQCDSE